MNITRAELKAAVDEAHSRGLKITGHLCAVTYREAAGIGIDDLEHGFFVNTEHDPGKTPDKCTRIGRARHAVAMDPQGSDATLISDLVAHHVAVTSTLPVFEQSVPDHAPLRPRAMAALTPQAATIICCCAQHTNAMPRGEANERAITFQHGMAMEREFVAAGGLLLAGPDPTGNGGVMPGFGDLREVELLVEAGFTPEQAIQDRQLQRRALPGLAGPHRLDRPRQGCRPGRRERRSSEDIDDIENVETVFKDGVGYDTQALLKSVQKRYGEY